MEPIFRFTDRQIRYGLQCLRRAEALGEDWALSAARLGLSSMALQDFWGRGLVARTEGGKWYLTPEGQAYLTGP